MTTPSSESPRAVRPVRAISRIDLTLAIVNGVIGSAVFGMPAQIAALTGVFSPVAHGIAALCVLTVVLCFAEVASRFEESGGPYAYAREAFGKHVGFQAGWLTLWTRLLAGAANLNVFANYLAQVAPVVGQGAGRAAVIVSVLVVITLINLIGVKQASWAVDLFTVAKLLPLGLLVVFGLPAVSAETIATQTVTEPSFSKWAEAILLLIFAFGGFEAPLMSAGEAKDPKRDSAFALLVGLAIIASVYIAIQYVAIGVVPNLQTEKAPIATAFRILWGPAGVLFAACAAMISVWGYTTGNNLQSPRLLYSMADRGELPPALAAIHERFRTPYVSIILFALMLGTLAIVGTFEGNAVLSAIVRLLVWAMVCVALWVFRRSRGPATFQVPAAPVVSAIGLAFCVYMLSTRSFAQAGIIVGTMIVGHVLMLASTKGR